MWFSGEENPAKGLLLGLIEPHCGGSMIQNHDSDPFWVDQLDPDYPQKKYIKKDKCKTATSQQPDKSRED